MPAPIDHISDTDWFATNQVDVLRLDQLEGPVAGNKAFKLKLNIELALNKGYDTILSFGGAYSNHIAALAQAGKAHNLRTIGVIRGESESSDNPTMSRARADGMELIFVSREEYGERNNPDYMKFVGHKYNAFVIPEGGSNYHGVVGCQDILDGIDTSYDYIFCAAGTGATASGLMLSSGTSQVCAVSVLKGDFMHEAIGDHLNTVLMDDAAVHDCLSQHHVLETYHFGGYAKWDQDLLSFVFDFHDRFRIKLDPVYTAKAAYAMRDYLNSAGLKEQKVLFIHTGGLQGIQGFEERFGLSLF